MKSGHRINKKARILLLIGFALAVIAIGGAIALLNPYYQKERLDKAAVTKIADQLQFPEGYSVVERHYFSSACLDVCPSITIRYRIPAGSSLNQLQLINYLSERSHFDQASPYIKHVDNRAVKLEGAYCRQPQKPNEDCLKVTI